MDFIKDLCEDWFGRFILLLIALTICFLIIIGVSVIKNKMDYISEGKVIYMKYTPAHTDFVLVGKIICPVYTDNNYRIEIENNKKYYTNINKEDYQKLHIGDWYKLNK